MFATLKRHILSRNRVFRRILRQNPSRGLGCIELQEPPKTGKKTSRVNTFGAQSHACAETESPESIVTNFCTDVRVHDIITSANFYDCRLWGLRVVGVKV